MKRVSKLKILALSAVFGVGMTMSFINEAAAATRAEIKRMVIEEAQNSRVPPALALAVAKTESDFQDRALSSAGARGVMQIMPKTAQGVFGVQEDELWNARLNIQLGIGYLEQLYDQYGGRWDLALSHYNGGTLGGGKGAYAQPHAYTRKYVADVLRWQNLYSEQANVWQVASNQALDDGWKPARTISRAQELDQTQRIVVRELQDREYDAQYKPWRIARNEQPVRPWRSDRKLTLGVTDFGQVDYTERLNRARQSLDDFTPVVRWTDG